MINRFTQFTATAICIALSGLAGCGGYPEVKSDVDASVQAAQKRIDAARAQSPVTRQEGKKAPLVEYTDKPFLGASSIARPADEPLPAAFSDVTLVFPGRHSMQETAAWITLATGIPVTLSPDLGLLASPGAAQGGAQPSANQQAQAVALNYHGSLREDLDGIAAQASASWQYKDGRITFFRYITKSFSLPYLPTLDAATQMVVGQATSASNGTTGTSASSSVGGTNTAFNSTLSFTSKPWDDIKEGLKNGILSPTGRAIVMPSSASVTVTDGPRQVEEAERFLLEQNRFFARQLAVRVQVISVTNTENSEFGVDWTAVLNKLNGLGTGQQVFTFTGPTGSASTVAGSMGVQILKQVNGTADFSGSLALLKALSTVGKVKVERTWETLALNRRVTPVAQVRTTGFIAATTPAPATVSGASGGVPGLTPGSITYGFVLNLMPTITSRNAVVLDFGLNLSDLNSLTPQSSGQGSNQQTIELPDFVANQMVPSVAMNTGDTLILSGLEQDTKQYNKRTLARDGSPLAGGLFQGTSERQSIMVLVTPVVAGF